MQEQTQTIRDIINQPRKQYHLMKKLGIWFQLCSCLDVIGDTDLMITAYTNKECGTSKGATYLAVYGLLQALFIQQDALMNLCESLGIDDKIENYPRLKEIQEIRNVSIGHPTRHNRKKSTSYHFISRISLILTGFDLLSSDENGKSQFEWISIPDLISDQQNYASTILISIIGQLEQEEASHKEQFRMEKLAAIFSDLSYPFEKMFVQIRGGDNNVLGLYGVQTVQKRLQDFQHALEKRGIELDTFDLIEEMYDLLKYPLAELEVFFEQCERGGEPQLNSQTAYIFAFFVQKKIDELRNVAREIDEEYAEYCILDSMCKSFIMAGKSCYLL